MIHRNCWRRAIIAYGLMVMLFILAGCNSKPLVIHHPVQFSGSGIKEVYVVNHGWHTGLIIPAHEVQKHIPELKQRFEDAPFIEFGWGDKGFYQAKEITAGLALGAILWPTQSVVHAVAVPENVEAYYSSSQVVRLCLNDEEISSLSRFIAGSFLKDLNGKINMLEVGIYGDSQFYEGEGVYHAMNTCNSWTAKGLRSIGMEVAPTLKITVDSIMDFVMETDSELGGSGKAGDRCGN